MFDADARFARCPGFELDEVDGAFLVVDMKRQRVLTLNAAASLVLGLCDGKRRFSEIVAMLKDAYPEARDRIEADAREGIEQLLAHGALERSGQSSPA